MTRRMAAACGARHTRAGQLSSCWSVVLGGALLAPLIAPYDPQRMDIATAWQPPSLRHWFGTDDFGRDVLSRLLFGARQSLVVGMLVVIFAVIARHQCSACWLAMCDGWTTSLMRFADALMAFPDILLAIALMAALGPSLLNVVLALGTVYTPRVARLVRGATLVLRRTAVRRGRGGVGCQRSRASFACTCCRIWFLRCSCKRTFIFAAAVLTEAALSFLGAGIPPTNPSWGNMIAGGPAILRPRGMADPGSRAVAILAHRACAANRRRRAARRARSKLAEAHMSTDDAAAGDRGSADIVLLAARAEARAVDGVSFDRPPRRDPGAGRRIRQRQVGDLAVDHAPVSDPAGPHRRRPDPVPRPRRRRARSCAVSERQMRRCAATRSA